MLNSLNEKQKKGFPAHLITPENIEIVEVAIQNTTLKDNYQLTTILESADTAIKKDFVLEFLQKTNGKLENYDSNLATVIDNISSKEIAEAYMKMSETLLEEGLTQSSKGIFSSILLSTKTLENVQAKKGCIEFLKKVYENNQTIVFETVDFFGEKCNELYEILKLTPEKNEKYKPLYDKLPQMLNENKEGDFERYIAKLENNIYNEIQRIEEEQFDYSKRLLKTRKNPTTETLVETPSKEQLIEKLKEACIGAGVNISEEDLSSLILDGQFNPYNGKPFPEIPKNLKRILFTMTRDEYENCPSKEYLDRLIEQVIDDPEGLNARFEMRKQELEKFEAEKAFIYISWNKADYPDDAKFSPTKGFKLAEIPENLKSLLKIKNPAYEASTKLIVEDYLASQHHTGNTIKDILANPLEATLDIKGRTQRPLNELAKEYKENPQIFHVMDQIYNGEGEKLPKRIVELVKRNSRYASIDNETGVSIKKIIADYLSDPACFKIKQEVLHGETPEHPLKELLIRNEEGAGIDEQTGLFINTIIEEYLLSPENFTLDKYLRDFSYEQLAKSSKRLANIAYNMQAVSPDGKTVMLNFEELKDFNKILQEDKFLAEHVLAQRSTVSDNGKNYELLPISQIKTIADIIRSGKTVGLTDAVVSLKIPHYELEKFLELHSEHVSSIVNELHEIGISEDAQFMPYYTSPSDIYVELYEMSSNTLYKYDKSHTFRWSLGCCVVLWTAVRYIL